MYFFLFLQSVDIRQIYDKFPEKKGGLKELYDKGPQAAFFLVKFWVRISVIHSKEQILVEEHSGSVVECWFEGLLVRGSLDDLHCVIEQDTLFSA